MQPTIHVLGISLKSFGIVFACGFLAAGAILVRRLRELGKPVDYSYEMAFAALVGGLVGSRLYYVIQNYRPGQARPAVGSCSPARGWSGTAA